MTPQLLKFLKYLQFKGDCIAYQQDNPIGLNHDLANQCIEELERQEEEKTTQLKAVMPKVPIYKEKKKPKNTHNKDGMPSVLGQRWFDFLKEQGLPFTHKEPVKIVDHYEEPNPGSTPQVKEWLFSLGWEPCTNKYVREADFSMREVPQVRYHSPSHPRKGELTDSVLLLKEKEPGIEALEGLTVVQHRLSIFRNFIKYARKIGDQWFIEAEIHGLTNTLRFKHKNPLVNLPGVDKPWGEEIRSCLIAPEGYKVVGADMVSLESTTKRHYIYPLDPEYAKEMSQPGFDEHLDLAVKAGGITKEDYDHYTKEVEPEGDRHKRIHKTRKKFKPVNYAAVYGVQPPKLSRETGMSKSECKQLLDAYWSRNWAVLECVKPLKVKKVGINNWMLNPVSGFWYQLRYDKDRFSTLNQGTGVYLFDSWLARCKLFGYMGVMQFHDETGGLSKDEDHTLDSMKKAIEKLNQDLNLNVALDIDVKFGRNYAEVH